MGILIDASILVEHERGRIDLKSRSRGREDELFFLSVITVSELLHGVHRARTPIQKATRSAFVESLIDRLPLLTVDPPTARAHAEISASLAASGQIVGPHDLWLAAAAIAHGLTLATANQREFARVLALSVETWS